MFIVFNTQTGESTEDMRFATRIEAETWIAWQWNEWEFDIREED